jgi:hypothetical protein
MTPSEKGGQMTPDKVIGVLDGLRKYGTANNQPFTPIGLEALTQAIILIQEGERLQAENERLKANLPSMEEIYEVLSLSSASQIFIANYSAEETQRAIDDMKEVAQTIHDLITKERG